MAESERGGRIIMLSVNTEREVVDHPWSKGAYFTLDHDIGLATVLSAHNGIGQSMPNSLISVYLSQQNN